MSGHFTLRGTVPVSAIVCGVLFLSFLQAAHRAWAHALECLACPGCL